MTTLEKKLVKATIPILKENGILLTKHFYNRMFTFNPELKNIFNMGNQANGKQQTALAMTVLAYAEHIDNPTILIDALKSIGNKHVSLNITKEQYDIVGNHLLESIKEVLKDAANNELINAWRKAYGELATIMISIEEEIYQNNINKNGGWKGWRKFIIDKIIDENIEIKSFYLKPKDGQSVASYLPGQYITIKKYINELGHEQPRQYSLSTVYNSEFYKISIKAEKGNLNQPEGIVSNTLHKMEVGDEIEISAPAGLFYYNKINTSPLVLISGGIGITPLISMLESQKENKNKTVWLHSCRNENVQTFKEKISTISNSHEEIKAYTYIEELENESNFVKKGRLNLQNHQDEILIDNAKYYICGPEMFIKTQYESLIKLGVNKNDIFFEEFGPHILNLN